MRLAKNYTTASNSALEMIKSREKITGEWLISCSIHSNLIIKVDGQGFLFISISRDSVSLLASLLRVFPLFNFAKEKSTTIK